MSERFSPLFGGTAALAGAIAYGINIPTARMAGMAGFSGAGQAMLRGLAFAVILGLILIVLRRSFRIDGGEGRRIAVMGLLSGAVGACYLSSVTLIPVATAVAVFYTFPLVLILAAPITGSGRITPPRVIAFAIAFTGIVICVGPKLGGLDWRGLALAFAASLACAALFEVTATVKQDRVRLLFWVQLGAMAFVIPAAMVVGLPSGAVLAAAALPVLISALGYYIGFAGQVIAGSALAPATVGLLFLLEPVVAVLAAQWLLDEVLTPLQVGGIALVLAGLGLDVWTQSRAAAAAKGKA
jgi:drug/metabolite transporter (DMT)-like permease